MLFLSGCYVFTFKLKSIISWTKVVLQTQLDPYVSDTVTKFRNLGNRRLYITLQLSTPNKE